MKKLLTNGCSHTEASECSKSFGDFIDGYEHINIAKGGCGNHRIMRTTMEYCENNQVDLVIIGWSTHERFEFSFATFAIFYFFFLQRIFKILI